MDASALKLIVDSLRDIRPHMESHRYMQLVCTFCVNMEDAGIYMPAVEWFEKDCFKICLPDKNVTGE
jgi:hypothetical protein